MEDLKVIKGCPAVPDKKQVMEWMECREDNPVYEEAEGLYEEIKEEIVSICRPVILLKFGACAVDLEDEGIRRGDPVVYGLCSIGEEISKRSTKAFAEGDGFLGMMINTMADQILFGLENEIEEILKKECAERKAGILRRLEAPQHMPMEMQKMIFQETQAGEKAGMRLTSGYMFDPVKSNGMLFVLTDDTKIFRAQHDCSRCSRTDCRMRREGSSLVTVSGRGTEGFCVKVKEEESILEAMRVLGRNVSAVCGNRGICGKCRIRVTGGVLEASEEDKRYFTEEELESGWRLACKAYPKSDLTMETEIFGESEFQVLSTYLTENLVVRGEEQELLGVAIDIGTTTLAFQLVGLKSGRIIHSCTGLNGQRIYGGDVISRIQASVKGEKEELRAAIQRELIEGIQNLIKESGIPKEKIQKAAVAANTTMVHLLMGYDCETLGVYPFSPVSVSLIEMGSRELLGSEEVDIPVSILPGVSAYVGGDIVSGLFQCGFDQNDKVCLLIDLGTNAEMAIGNADKILTTSAAAGPAFEGGNIRWGTGSIPGAISSVAIGSDGAVCTTIDSRPPVGICGTGVIEAVSELVRTEAVEETGLLEERFFENGYPLGKTENGESIVFTQQDVREIQLAKAAIRAGIETLAFRFGIRQEQIEKIYLAGGFGFRLDLKKAEAIGMFPREFEGKIITVGNSSLGGAAKFLTETDGRERILRLSQKAAEINLSADPHFNNCYMESMFF